MAPCPRPDGTGTAFRGWGLGYGGVRGLQPGAQPRLYPQCLPAAWCCPCSAAPSPPAAQVRGGHYGWGRGRVVGSGSGSRSPQPLTPPRPSAAMALQPPRITRLRTPPVSPPHPSPGSNVSVSCEAESAHSELTLLYWLGNGSFVEQLQPNVREGGSLVTLRRDLHFTSFSFQDLSTNFTCVLLSPFGTDIRELKWAPSEPPPAKRLGEWAESEQNS
uniref:Ig-like domain-containing protein n=1 Tax=Pavo cristatus TaxID=9049 RepID=A0A8C9L2L8_PAVCR